MKKKIKVVIVFLFVLVFIPVSIVLAETSGGGTGGSGAGGGSGGSGTVVNTFYYQFGGPSGSSRYIDVAAYKYELAYFNKDGSREILGTIVAQDQGSVKSNLTTKDIIISRVKSYASNIGAKYLTSGKLVDLSRRLEKGEEISDIFPWDNASQTVKIENAEWILGVVEDEFGLPEEEMQKEQDPNPGRYESYGYRILIQKIQLYGVSGGYYTSFAATRKDVASDVINDGIYNAQGINRCVQLFGMNTGFSRELYTKTADVHISNGLSSAGTLVTNTGSGYNYNRFCNSAGTGFSGIPGSEDKTSALANWQDGLGYNILWFDTEGVFKNYDYSIDAACVNCNVTTTGNKAYIIQDINDWEAIFASDSSSNTNVKTYYNKGNGVYCREEYTVYFPDNSDVFYVEPGRYFTLNASASALDKVSATATFPNFKPIKVVKKRVCKVNNGDTSALDAFRRKSESTFKGRTGTVSFKYNETYSESRYNMDDSEELEPYDEPNNYTYSINGDTLTMEVTRNYTLPDNYYQYVRKQDGLSMKTKPSSNLSYYINVGISNLPISFKNYGHSNQKAADIQFSFELPSDDPYSKLNKAYIKDNSYLKTDNSDGNIYKKYKENNMSDGDQELLNNSACAKMFGINTSGFESCASHRIENSIGDGGYNCISQNELSLTGDSTKGYSCMVLSNDSNVPGNPDCNSEEDAKNQGLDWNPVGKYCCPAGTKYNSKTGKCESNDNPGDSCDSESDATSQGRDWNPIGKYCCPVGTTYNPSTGKCEGSGDNNGCNSEEDATEQGRDWNPKTNTCCPVGTMYNPSTGKCDDGGDNTCRIENGKYYDFNGNEITKDEYDILCPSDVPYYCPEDECPYGCCPSGECAPMPDGTCPGSSGIDVIYRTIDLENPFPGQNAENRETGANWCSYNIKTQQIDCKYNNQTVKNYITRERSGTVNGGKVYREDHVLYEVTLDTETINSIRNYNDKNKYDDWDLECLENGKACVSDFLNSEVTTTGKCANVSRTNFYTCDEDV